MLNYLRLSVLVVGASAAADRPNLSGTWLLDAAHSQIRDSKLKTETLEIKQKGDVVEIADDANAGGKDRKSDYQCPTDGSICRAKDLSVMLYYDGPALIVMEMRHNNEIVIGKRLTPSPDGKTLIMNVSHVAPAGLKDESLTFVKQN
jgi:hypothetical protein